MEKKINMIINDTPLVVDEGITIMEAAKQIGVEIPRLCFLKGIHEESNCRVCVVEIEGKAGLNSSCSVKVFEGMKVTTNSKEVKKAVEKNLELVAANHVFECWVCSREHNCELLDLMRTNNVANTLGEDAKFTKRERVINDASVAIVLDSGKCTLCGRCISACHKQASTHVLDFNNRGVDTIVGPAQLLPMETSGCILCGKCIQACPVAAIKEKDDLEILEDYLDDEDKFVIVQAAPSVRVALGEEFGMDYGLNVEGKMYAAFNELGFDDIADTNFGADLTIMEEGNEFIQKLKDPNAKFPMFTSCSPGWVRYIEQYRQEYLAHLSSAKSPHQMAGAVIKHYYAKKINVDPKKVINVSVMPCIAKKFESARPEMEYDGLRDVDIVITTRELARLIKRHKINFAGLEDFVPDGDFAQFSGAGLIFGATGGVMEAALRTVQDVLTGESLDQVDFESIRGTKDIKEATLNIGGKDINIAVVHGGSAIEQFFEILDENKKQYHFVELMGCTGGCVNGGGQPIIPSRINDDIDIRALRAGGLYNKDAQLKVRKSHENEAIKNLYAEFLGEPCSGLAHDMLHTTFSEKSIY